jgi:hypothetical protein
MSDDQFPHDTLVRCLDAAAEQMRAANHQTYTSREVTDLYPVLGALHALFSRFDQLAGYLLRTVRQADAVDFRHDEGDDVALVLTAVEDGIEQARDLTAQTVRSLDGAWQQLSRLALDIPDLVCPECGEPAHRGTPTDLTPMQRTAGIRPRYRHADGSQLCPVVGPHGYQPAPPHAPDSPSPIASPTHQDEPDPEGQH